MLGARGHADVGRLAVDGRDRDRRSQSRVRHVEVDVDLQIVLGPLEARVGLEAHQDEEVAGRSAPPPGLALPRDAQGGAVVDAGRDPDGQLGVLAHAARAAALPAGVLHALALPPAVRAGLGHGEEALRELHPPHAPAGGTALQGRAVLGARAFADRAGLHAVEVQGELHPPEGVLQRDVDLVLEVRPAPGPAPTAAAAAASAAEELLEDVAEHLAHVHAAAGEGLSAREASGEAPGPGEARFAVLVVDLPLLGVGEGLVGGVDPAELLLRLLVARVAVRMILHGELAVGRLDLGLRGVARHPEQVVEVFSHLA